MQKYLKIGGIAAGAFVLYKLVKPLAGLGSTLGNMAATRAENAAIKTSTGLTDEEVQLCRDVANQTHASMYVTGFWQMSWFGGSTEDEDEVIRQLNRLVTPLHAQVASDFYKTLSGESLASEVNKYLDADDRKKIKSLILSNLR